jgi:hypothetical protein
MTQRLVTPQEVAQAKRESLEMIPHGFIWARVLDDGRCVYLSPSLKTPGKIFLGLARNIDARAYYSVWEYEPHDAAWHAAIGWDGHGEPKGYLRRVVVPHEHAGEPS